MTDKFKEWENKEHNKGRQLAAIIPSVVFFLAILPAFLILVPFFIERKYDIPGFFYLPVNLVFGIIFIITGIFFAVWSVYTEFVLGKGTPLPVMPTKKLVIKGPFRFCRNPMSFGALTFYFGIGILMGSYISIGISVILTTILLLYLKFIEEKELETRFGKEYIDYKKTSSFIIPRSMTRKKWD